MTAPTIDERITAVEFLRLVSKAVEEKGTSYKDQSSEITGENQYFITIDPNLFDRDAWENQGEYDPELGYEWPEYELPYLSDKSNAPAGCIVGHVFDYKYRGKRDDIIGWIASDYNGNGVNDEGLSSLLTPLAVKVAEAAQIAQDRGNSWGEAYAKGIEELGLMYAEADKGLLELPADA